TLKAALDTYQSELRSSDRGRRTELVDTIQRELDKVATRIHPDVLAVSDLSGTVLAAAGTHKAVWPSVVQVPIRRQGEQMLTLPSGVFRRVIAPLALGDAEVGVLELA